MIFFALFLQYSEKLGEFDEEAGRLHEFFGTPPDKLEKLKCLVQLPYF
jgi:hypothetical protein